jgi:hypothetical protein
MSYPTFEEYKKWVAKVNENENPDRYILETFFDTVEQYMNDPKSLVTELTLRTAMGCVDRYLEDNS